MKRKFLVLLCVAALAVCAFASCEGGLGGPGGLGGTGNGGSGECEHTFSENWSNDATNHWHAATCEHGEIKDSLAAHSDADEDGLCDVCSYEVGHTHTYNEEWTIDETKHWKDATCTHTSVKADESLHVDDDSNGECDVCTGHVHILDVAGYCTGCEKLVSPIDETDIAAVINALVARSGKVLSSKVNYDEIMRGLESNVTREHTVNHVFGTNGSYIERVEDEIEVIGTFPDAIAVPTGNDLITKNWLKAVSDETVTGVTAQYVNDKVIYAEPISVTTDNLIGYYFAVSTLANEYGAEAILNTIYNLSKSDTASDYNVIHDADINKYEISYNILIINTDTAAGEDDNVNYYEVKISFTYSDDYVLTGLNIVCDCYSNSLPDPDEQDYTWDQATKTITMKENAKADTYTFSVAQTIGERVELDLNDGSEFTPTSIEFYTDPSLTQKAESITVDVGNFEKQLYISCAPEGTFLKFITGNIKVKATNQYGITARGFSATLTGEVIYLFPNTAGEFIITVSAGDISSSINVTSQIEEVAGEYKFELTASDNNTFDGNLYDFKAPKSGTYTFYTPYGASIWEKYACDYQTGDPLVDYDNPYGTAKSFSIQLAEGETFSFYYKLTVKNYAFTIGYDIEEHEVEAGGNTPTIPTGTLILAEGDNTIVISEDEIDADIATRGFRATATGLYTFTSNNLIFFTIKDAAGNVISPNTNNAYSLTEGINYTITYSNFTQYGIKANIAYSVTVELAS